VNDLSGDVMPMQGWFICSATGNLRVHHTSDAGGPFTPEPECKPVQQNGVGQPELDRISLRRACGCPPKLP
jgi:hypothetical protein